MEQRLTLITLGVSNLIESERFYSDILGWKKSEINNDDIVFYSLSGIQLALYPIDKLAEDAKVNCNKLDFRGFTLAYNCWTEEEVNVLFYHLREKGVEIIKEPEKVFWGGYSGYFADPDKNLWEVAYNPFMQMKDDDNVINNNDIKVSIANRNDLDTILELQKEAYIQEAAIYNDFEIPPLKQTINSLRLEWQNGIVLKAVKNGQIVGSVRAIANDMSCKIGKLIVKPDSQNQGIGKMLLHEIEKLYDNCAIYELFTGYKSEKNLAIYRKNGFKDYREERINANVTLIYLEKHNNTIS